MAILNTQSILTLFQMESPIYELFIRATVIYVGILILMRILPRRTGGELAIMDLIFVILIAEGASHALGDYTSITEGFVIIASLMFWNYFVNLLSFHIPFIERLISAPPIKIIQNGKLLRKNMRMEYLTEEELMDSLRKEGIERTEDVKCAFIESDGKISIIKAL